MRLIIVVAFILLVAGAIGVLLKLKKPDLPAGSAVYQGAGETNLDLDSPDNTVHLELKDGRVTIRMRPDLAPKHVARIKELVREGFYDGLLFHRVIDGFMAQTGDPLGDGTGGSGVFLPAEFSDAKFKRGVVGMARAQHDDSADSQFFIMLDDGRFLDGKYTVVGEVSEGMEHVDAIKKGDPAANGKVSDPDKIERMSVKGDGN